VGGVTPGCLSRSQENRIKPDYTMQLQCCDIGHTRGRSPNTARFLDRTAKAQPTFSDNGSAEKSATGQPSRNANAAR